MPTIHRFDSTGEAYDLCQCSEHIHKGDVLWIPSERVVGIADTWPIAVTTSHGKLHYTDDSAAGADYFVSNPYAQTGLLDAIELAQALGYPIMAHLLPPPSACELVENDWIPACGGSEVPFDVGGRRLHYLWNRTTGEHAYYDLRNDIFLTNAEAHAILGAP